MKTTLTLLAALLLAPLAVVHAAEPNVAPNGNNANPGTKAERSPLPAKKQGNRSSQLPSRTQDYGDFSLNKVWFVLDKYPPPTGAFDPAKDAPAHFTLFTLASRRPCGRLTLRRANGPGDTVTLTSEYLCEGGSAFQATRTEAVCRRDLLLSPAHWSYESKQFAAPIPKGEPRPFAPATLTRRGTVEDDVVTIHRGEKASTVRITGPLTHAWTLFDAVQRLPQEKTQPVSFSLIEEGDILKERQTLCYYRSRTVKLGGASIKLDGYLQTGDGILPTVYWVNGEGRLLFVIRGALAWVRDSGPSKTGNQMWENLRAAAARPDLTTVKSGEQSRASASPKPEASPNIVMIVCDQLSQDALSAHGNPWVRTPQMDRLARRGVSFELSYSTHPVCSPARSSLFTGRMTGETGVTANGLAINRNMPNMGQWFQNHSVYRRYYCGKWHIPQHFSSFEGPQKIAGFDTIPVGEGALGCFEDTKVSAAVGGFLQNDKSPQPFLLVVNLLNPHDICYWGFDHLELTAGKDEFGLGDRLPLLPANHRYRFAEPRGAAICRRTTWSEMSWRNYLHDYYRMVEMADAEIGRVLDAIEARPDAANTLVFVTADHGDGGAHHERLQKLFPYDSAAKVPFLVSWPERVRQGVRDSTHLVSGVDLMSTACDYAGIPAPPDARGLSLRPLLEGQPASGWRTNLYMELQAGGRMIRTERFKYVKYYTRLPEPGQPGVEDPVKLLFDMKADPLELRNLASDPAYSQVMAEHDKILREQWEGKLARNKAGSND